MIGEDALATHQDRYVIRPAEVADLDRSVELLLDLQDLVEGSAPTLWRMTAKARDDLKGQVSARLSATSSCALVAEHHKDGIVGVIFGRIIVNNRYTPSRAGQIDQAFVSAVHRRKGIGSQLVAALCRFFAAEGVEDIIVRYAAGNVEANAFWSALGFLPRITVAGASRRIIEQRTDRDRISRP